MIDPDRNASAAASMAASRAPFTALKTSSMSAGTSLPANAVQVMSALYIKEHHATLAPAVIDVSKEMDLVIANKKLDSRGVEIDVLTPEQEAYLKSWQV